MRLPLLPCALLVVMILASACTLSGPCRARYAGDLRLDPVYRGDLEYPAGVNGISGRVSLHVRVERMGSVSSVVVIASEPAGVFEQAAVDYVSDWRYCPRTRVDADFPFPMLVEVDFRPAG